MNVMAIGLAVLIAGQTFAQQPSSREFAAVSIKLDDQKGPRRTKVWRLDPTRVAITGYTLKQFVEAAFDLKSYQLDLKGPKWIEDDWYDLEARTEAPATEAEMMKMLQPVLVERFHLVFHRETREIPVYLLDVAYKGAKLERATVTEGGNLTVHKDSVTAFHLTMSDFADVLSQFVTDRPVFNRTGLNGEYKFKLEFAPADDSNAGPTIFSALPDQLGLKLEAGKAPVEILMIDDARRPSAN